MALPTAPLGSLPNLNVPTHLQMYEKPRSTLDKALQAFLVGVAQQAGGQVINNAMSRDYAEKPAGFLQKLGSGPKENQALYQQRQGLEAQSATEQARLDAALGQQRASQDFATQERIASEADKELARGDTYAQQRGLEQLRQTGDITRDTSRISAESEAAQQLHEKDALARFLLSQDEQASNVAMLQAKIAAEQAQQQQNQVGQRLLEQERQIGEKNSPQGQYYKEHALQLKGDRERMDRAYEEARNKGKKTVNPQAMNAVVGGGQPTAQSTTTPPTAQPGALEQFLQSRGVAPEALQASNQAQATQQAARAQEEQAAAAQRQTLQQNAAMMEHLRINNPDLYRKLMGTEDYNKFNSNPF